MSEATAPPPVALVTGAERGIGKECARQLLECGYTVILGCYDLSEAAITARELSPLGTVHVVALDVADDDSIAAAMEAVADITPVIDALVNNAGVTALGSARDVTRAQLHSLFDVNAFGAALLTRAALPLLARASSPRIVNVSSGGGSLTRAAAFAAAGGPGAAILAYASSKAALNMITVQTRLTLDSDPALRHIKINSVGPGTTATQVSGFVGQHPSDGARVLVLMATLDDDGPTGGFFEWEGPVEW
ncbi:SDR family NAD(P)-dependent oxidoreductase [Cryobacterium sp. SO2]|uniref:SDR family NAD(P)-dependent oxidoreductase n=1 Tax=Cryobacterium sp. SO2 TaxID=1897060 RepID=UPI00223E6392|nr:SDR family NAD(P)-dependent oxidoreductase [Cryobacterium sp. SO2]WEO77299.1 SDR family NAD(P)-dependent oxidoreductase [Cryobacterium sp. SO2]